MRAVLAAVAALALAATAWAQQSTPSAPTDYACVGRINAAGQASLSVAPDKAVTAWSLHINATDANSPLVTQADARNATATILQNIFSQLGADGIPQQALQTDSITFSPINQRVKVLRTDLEPQLTCWCQDGWAMKSDCFTWQDQTSGWSATVAFSVTLTGASVDPKTLSDVISKVLAAGKDNVTLTDLRFDLSSDLRQKSELAVATKAVADARSKADAFAQAAGGRLQLPLKVQETPITDDSIGTPITLTPVPTAQPAQTSAGVATLATRNVASPLVMAAKAAPQTEAAVSMDPSAALPVAPKPVVLSQDMYVLFSMCAA